MQSLSIRIRIADRDYPMRAPAGEEERLRKAGRLINEKLREFKAQYNVDDRQDLLSMVAIYCMAEKIRLEELQQGWQHENNLRMEHLAALLEQAGF